MTTGTSARVAIRKQAAPAQRNAKRLEVAGADVAKFGSERRGVGLHRPSGDGEECVPAPVLQRQVLYESSGAHAGRLPDAALQLPQVASVAAGCAVVLQGCRQTQRQHVVRDEAGGRLLQAQEAAHQKTRAGEQHEGERDLSHHQGVAQPAAPTRGAVAAGLLQGRLRVGARCRQRRQNSERDAGDRAGGQQETKDAPVNANLPGARNLRGREFQNQPGAAHGKQQPADSARQAEQHALGQKLLHHAAPAGAQRRPHRDLVRSSGGASQQQVGHIRAGDQQEQSDGAEQGEQRRAHGSADEFGQRRKSGTASLIGSGVLCRQPACQHVQLLARRFDRYSGLQPSHRVLDSRIAIHCPLRRHAQGNPHFGQRCTIGELEALRHHADDGERFVAEADLASDARGVGAEATFP